MITAVRSRRSEPCLPLVSAGPSIAPLSYVSGLLLGPSRVPLWDVAVAGCSLLDVLRVICLPLRLLRPMLVHMCKVKSI